MKSLNKKLVTLLKRKKLKLAVAESCTGGMLSSNITSISGSSAIFTMGLVTYSNYSKKLILKIPNRIIQKYGAVSDQCCFSMVNNLCKISKCDIGVSITGISGPRGGTKKKPVGLVYIGVKKHKKIKINKYLFRNHSRSSIQKSAVKKSIELILSVLK